MSRNYRCVMSDGSHVNHRCNSAAEAIGFALGEKLGQRVLECRAGMEQFEAKWKHTEAFMYFDVPEHVPLTKKPVPDRISRQTRGAGDLFDDEQILNESARAMTRAKMGELGAGDAKSR